VGRELTVTITSSVAVPQASVIVTVYVVVAAGPATGFGQFVQLNPVAGDHANVPLPLAKSAVLSPSHTDTSEPALTDGLVVIVTVTSSETELHPVVTVSV
jgi:hypothetical protein